MGQKIKIFVVEENSLFRKSLLDILQSMEDTECIGNSSSESRALSKIRKLQPDLMIMELYEFENEGLKTIREIKKSSPKIQFILFGKEILLKENVDFSLNYSQLGILDIILKPKIITSEQSILDKLNQQILPLVQMVVIQKLASLCYQPKQISPKTFPTTVRVSKVKSLPLVLIGISTGGPKALEELIPSLSSKFPCPIIIIQHMPELFTAFLAEQLSAKSSLVVKEAEEGETPKKGFIYIAPGGKHLVLKEKKASTTLSSECDSSLVVFSLDNSSPPLNNCKPSVDKFLFSIPKMLQDNLLVVIMTGMGKDGTEGLKKLKQKARPYCVIQDQESSVVWGMPGQVFKEKLADEVLPLDEIGKRMMELSSI